MVELEFFAWYCQKAITMILALMPGAEDAKVMQNIS